MEFLLLKFFHILAVILFVGNITTGVFWHRFAARTRDPKLIAHTMNGIVRSDRIFTVPAVIAIIVTGIAAAIQAQFPILRTGWILATLILFAIAGVIFSVRVAPLQRQLLGLAEAAARAGNFDYANYRAVAARWEIWGAAALLTPAAGIALMVMKPSF